jgi:DNA-binding Lrp family transcriptional regulator
MELEHICDVPLRPLERRLLDMFQRNLPLVPRPYQAMADAVGSSEGEVLEALNRLHETGVLSRVGFIVRPNTAGASTLAAMAVPENELEAVAARISARPEVNHNYEREHRLNLWFVVAAEDVSARQRALIEIERETGYAVLDLPLEAAYHIDLGFALASGESMVQGKCKVPDPRARMTIRVTDQDRHVLAAVQDGLSVAPCPFAEPAARLGVTESELLRELRWLVTCGVIKRCGLIVRHHELGYRSNAMVVWNVPDHWVDEVGSRLATLPFVTLCYRRPRRLPDWPFNLFCMIHGRDRNTVMEQVGAIRAMPGLADIQHAVLFSRRRFKQRGATLCRTREAA